jgi:rhomboid protease GluP
MKLPPKIRFKWERWKSTWQARFGEAGQAYQKTHRMCPNCRALIARDASVCPLCGARTGSLRTRGGDGAERILGIIPIPSTATSVLVAVNIILYGLSWYLTQTLGADAARGDMGGIRGDVLVRFGAKFGPLVFAGEWWRLVTAMFLHASLLHIGMNLWCLFDLGPEVESLFSTPKFIVLYLVTGVAGFVLSLAWSPRGLSVGASGAILGMIGILIGASFRHGQLGKAYRATLIRWVIYIAIFGLFFALDNAAHLGGLATGALLGYVVPEGEPATRASQRLWNTLAVFAILIMAASFALMALQLNRPLR